MFQETAYRLANLVPCVAVCTNTAPYPDLVVCFFLHPLHVLLRVGHLAAQAPDLFRQSCVGRPCFLQLPLLWRKLHATVQYIGIKLVDLQNRG